MAIDADLYARSQAHAGLSALIGTRFYPVTAPQGVAAPYCVYAQLGDDPVHAMGDDTGLVSVRYEIACYGSGYDAARAVGAQVRDAFSRYSGTPSVLRIDAIFLEDVDTGFDENTSRYFQDLNFTIWYQEA